MSEETVRVYLYHAKEAPEGRIFNFSADDEVRQKEIAELTKGGWKDAPVKAASSPKKAKAEESAE